MTATIISAEGKPTLVYDHDQQTLSSHRECQQPAVTMLAKDFWTRLSATRQTLIEEGVPYTIRQVDEVPDPNRRSEKHG